MMQAGSSESQNKSSTLHCVKTQKETIIHTGKCALQPNFVFLKTRFILSLPSSLQGCSVQNLHKQMQHYAKYKKTKMIIICPQMSTSFQYSLLQWPSCRETVTFKQQVLSFPLMISLEAPGGTVG